MKSILIWIIAPNSAEKRLEKQHNKSKRTNLNKKPSYCKEEESKDKCNKKKNYSNRKFRSRNH